MSNNQKLSFLSIIFISLIQVEASRISISNCEESSFENLLFIGSGQQGIVYGYPEGHPHAMDRVVKVTEFDIETIE